MPKFASSRMCPSQIGRNEGEWRVAGHGHWAASLRSRGRGIILIIGIFSASPALVLGKHDHLARMISFAHLATLEAGTIPSSHSREGNGRRERFTHASEGTQLIRGGGQTPVRAVPLSTWYSHLPCQAMAPRYILGPGSASSSPIGPPFRGPSYSGIIRIFLVGTAWLLDLFEAQFPKSWLSLDSTLLFPGRLSWQTLPVIQLMMLWVQERGAPTQPVLKKKLSYPRNRCGVLHLSGLQQSLLAASTNLSIPNLIRQTGRQLSSWGPRNRPSAQGHSHWGDKVWGKGREIQEPSKHPARNPQSPGDHQDEPSTLTDPCTAATMRCQAPGASRWGPGGGRGTQGYQAQSLEPADFGGSLGSFIWNL